MLRVRRTGRRYRVEQESHTEDHFWTDICLIGISEVIINVPVCCPSFGVDGNQRAGIQRHINKNYSLAPKLINDRTHMPSAFILIMDFAVG